jgi:hypothetical protein
VEFTENIETPTWQALGTLVADPSGVIDYVDHPPEGAPARFYRVSSQ